MFGPPTDQNLLSDVLNTLDKKLLETSTDIYSDLYQRVKQVFMKVFNQMLEEQKKVNPDKFAYVKTLDESVVAACASIDSLPKMIDFSADNDKIHNLDFYVQQFFSNPQ